jgi:UDP-N-acetylglucosamine:LPS N-acetylglucosamine transferase
MTKKILIFTTQEGHLSIAKALQEALASCSDLQVERSNILNSLKAFKVYTPFYRYFPSLFSVPYKLGQKDSIKKTFKTIVKNLMDKEVKNVIKAASPDLIFSTHFLYNPAILKFLDYQKQPIPFINMITDPWTIHPLLLSAEADLSLVYDQKAVKIARQNQVEKNKLKAIGWPVRAKFYQTYNLSRIRKSLGFKKNKFTLLICGGSEGTNMVLKIIPALLANQKPLQLIVVCGTNKTLYKAVRSLKDLLPKLANSGINNLKNMPDRFNIKIFQFTDKLAELMQVSDLVVGKAGPNLIFESVASQKPFLAICHISGQEDGNLALIKKKRLGYVEENTIKVVKLLRKIMDNPKILNKFDAALKKERENNLKTKDAVKKLALDLIASA